jgi:leucine carboxyl methyltransferase
VEDELDQAIKHGISQYVILGAGLDSFAYRRPDLVDVLHVFEVDYPATQTWKRTRLQHLGVASPRAGVRKRLGPRPGGSELSLLCRPYRRTSIGSDGSLHESASRSPAYLICNLGSYVSEGFRAKRIRQRLKNLPILLKNPPTVPEPLSNADFFNTIGPLYNTTFLGVCSLPFRPQRY